MSPEGQDALCEVLTDALQVEWLKHADAKTVDSPRGHCERLAVAAYQALLDAGYVVTRREVANEVADALAARAEIAQRIPASERSGVREGMVVTWLAAEKLAREIGSREATE
jgi:hypothetical protein